MEKLYYSSVTGKSATNELPLKENPATNDDTNESAETATTCNFTNPLTISEDVEFDTTSSAEILQNHKSPSDKKYNSTFIIHSIYFIKNLNF